MQVISADSVLRKAGLIPEVSGARFSSGVAPGGVLSQLPSTGTREKTDSVVKMVVSEGRHPTALPRVVGLSEARAAAAVRRAHLVPRFSSQYNETIAAGVVVSWHTATGRRVYYGDSVDLMISKGPAPEQIPTDLSGGVLTATQANSALEDLRLTPVDHQEYSTSVSLGYVIRTRPAPGQTVPGHSTVQVYVSAGPPFVAVPLLYEDSVAVAEQTLSSWDCSGLSTVPPNG